METNRVPNLDWPKDLFRDAVAVTLIEDLDNPFLEDSDFAPGAEPAIIGTSFVCPDYALAE